MSQSHKGSEARPAASSYTEANPQLYAFLEWMAEQDTDYSQAFRTYTEMGTGEG